MVFNFSGKSRSVTSTRQQCHNPKQYRTYGVLKLKFILNNRLSFFHQGLKRLFLAFGEFKKYVFFDFGTYALKSLSSRKPNKANGIDKALKVSLFHKYELDSFYRALKRKLFLLQGIAVGKQSSLVSALDYSLSGILINRFELSQSSQSNFFNTSCLIISLEVVIDHFFLDDNETQNFLLRPLHWTPGGSKMPQTANR